MTDEEILKKLELGGKEQEKALSELYTKKAKEFWRFFISRGLDKGSADEVVQEAILKILKQASAYKNNGSANAWMWQIARNELMDYFRFIKREKHNIKNIQEIKLTDPNDGLTDLGAIDPSRAAEDCVTQGLLRFEVIDPDRAYAIRLVVEGVDGKEIADRIGRTYTAARQYLTQCRQHLAPYIKDCLPLLAT